AVQHQESLRGGNARHADGDEVAASSWMPSHERRRTTSMATTASLSFSLPQRVLHWLTAGFVFFNLLFPDGMNAWNRSIKQTGAASAEQVASANIHAYAGIAILILVALRLLLRQIQGVPAAPTEEPQMFKLVAKVAEWTLYLL